jgi:L-rhamnose isomerase
MYNKVENAYRSASKNYSEIGVDTDAALERLAEINLTLHCWQGDDVRGFEIQNTPLGGGLLATGAYPGRARTPTELRIDLEKALSLIPGKKRVNIHASYREYVGNVDRDEIEPEHFTDWIKWAKLTGVKLDFNATLFSHPKAEAGFTLSSKDKEIRRFWVEHVKRSRKIAAYIGAQQDSPCIHNLWIPDGMKDQCVDKYGYRSLLKESLEEIYSVKYDAKLIKDSVESKLFGLGSETFVVGSHEFYIGYALSRNIMMCLDMGHYHPTESIADKLSSLLQFFPEICIHISRGVRWDSDHVPILDDQLIDVAVEIVRCKALENVHIALDYFDSSINRVGAWVTGARATQKAILLALLEPTERLSKMEEGGDYTGRLAWLEEMKGMPLNAVYDRFSLERGVPVGLSWLKEIRDYENTTQLKRNLDSD